ncbi:MAG: hypothetical protein ACYYK0_01705 [Candidatus Eutrophobiaceae bacterium]
MHRLDQRFLKQKQRCRKLLRLFIIALLPIQFQCLFEILCGILIIPIQVFAIPRLRVHSTDARIGLWRLDHLGLPRLSASPTQSDFRIPSTHVRTRLFRANLQCPIADLSRHRRTCPDGLSHSLVAVCGIIGSISSDKPQSSKASACLQVTLHSSTVTYATAVS